MVAAAIGQSVNLPRGTASPGPDLRFQLIFDIKALFGRDPERPLAPKRSTEVYSSRCSGESNNMGLGSGCEYSCIDRPLALPETVSLLSNSLTHARTPAHLYFGDEACGGPACMAVPIDIAPAPTQTVVGGATLPNIKVRSPGRYRDKDRVPGAGPTPETPWETWSSTR